MAVPTIRSQPAAPVRHHGLVDRFSVVLVAVAATLWASDTYFRAQLVGHLKPAQIVVIEDGLVSLFLLVFLLRGIPELRQLGRRGWVAIGLIAVGPQAVATILFTQSFSYGHYAETFVLQQTQPLIAILLAWLILGERRRPWFWPTAALAILGVYMVVFAQNLTAPFSDLQHGRLEAGLYALGAAALWASGTVLGRFVLGTLSFTTTTALRFTLALPVLILIVVFQFGISGFTHYQSSDALPFLGIALIPGFIALLLYYRALASTPATLATIAEMAFPVAATFIASAPPPYGFNQPLYLPQFIGTALLIGVIFILNWTKERTPPVVVQAEAAA
ncbi:MAG TPA: EamA family transporter [Candidatus Dormibacteraeota bacterium]|nr:EamA family transporter [Candidatus Dormibacteraeota bacterium]